MVTPAREPAAIPQTPNTWSMSKYPTSPKCLTWFNYLNQYLTKSHILHLVLSLSPSIFYFEKNITPPEKCMNMHLDPPTVPTLSPLTVEELVTDTHNCVFSSVAITWPSGKLTLVFDFQHLLKTQRTLSRSPTQSSELEGATAAPQRGSGFLLYHSHSPLLSDTSSASLSLCRFNLSSTPGALWKPYVSWGGCHNPLWRLLAHRGAGPPQVSDSELSLTNGIPAPLPPPGRMLTVLSLPKPNPCLSGWCEN